MLDIKIVSTLTGKHFHINLLIILGLGGKYEVFSVYVSHREVGNLSGTSISIEVLGYMALPKGLLCRKTLSTVTDILFNMSGPFDP